MKTFLPITFHQNEWKNLSDANVSVATHSLYYGIGAFGGLCSIPNPKNLNEILLFRLQDHTKRL